jgi:hypothetical protein
VPGQARAFYADRVLANTHQRGELAELGLVQRDVRRGRDRAVEALEDPLGLLRRLAAHRLGHQGRGGRRDRAALALEAHVADRVALEPQVHGELIATERVVPARGARETLERPEVPRAPRVVEDHFMVEVAQIAHRENSSRT